MARYFFDIETDGLLEQTTKIHSLVLIDADTGQMHSEHEVFENEILALQSADEIIGHNIIGYDLQVIEKLYPWFKPKGKITDTLVLSRLLFADMYDRDQRAILRRKIKDMPGKLRGSHSLKAWGIRLGEWKGDYAEQIEEKLRQVHKDEGLPPPTKDQIAHEVWGHWSPSMQSYCEQDVAVTAKLYHRLMQEKPSEQSVWLEHEFAKIITMQERHGYAFDEVKAGALYQRLVKRRLEIAKELQIAFPPKEIETTFIPKVNNKTRGYVKGVPFIRTETIEFNPSSRIQIADRLKALGWVPTEFTDEGDEDREGDGRPKVDETILSKLPYPEAKVLAEHFLIEKRIGQLAEGNKAWLKLVKAGRLHGRMNTNGAVTGRCTHQDPNMGQVPAVGSPYGEECRELFTVTPGYRQVGVDGSGLELRCLAHFMARFDGGQYARDVVEGDIHWVNVKSMGLTQDDRITDEEHPHYTLHKIYRDKGAKRFIYMFLYGGGDKKAGEIINDLLILLRNKGYQQEAAELAVKFFGHVDAPSEEDLKRAGKKLKAMFLKKTPALKKLQDKVKESAIKGWITGLDGRKLTIRSPHSALNTLLQSAGALIAKAAAVFAYTDLVECGYVWGKDFAQIAHCHDEAQYESRKGLEVTVGETGVNGWRKAGALFGFKCPIDGEYKIGSNWKECH